MAPYQLAFQHVQLAMARHRLGAAYGIPLSTLAVTEVYRSEKPRTTSLLCIQPKVVQGELYMRVQQCIKFDHAQQDQRSVLPRIEKEQLSICSHLSWPDPEAMTALVKCKMLHPGTELRCPTCQPLLKCSACDMEFRVVIERLDHDTTAVFITKWMNMGCGETPQDPRWQRFLTEDYDPVACLKAAGESDLCWEYEREYEQPCDDLRKANALVLADRRYQQSYERSAAYDFWIQVP